MSSWIARSLAANLRLNNDDDEEQGIENKNENESQRTDKNSTYEEIDLEDHRFDTNNVLDSSDVIEGHGVKEDLSELKQTLTRQLWDVASFLAPPPPPPPPLPPPLTPWPLAGMADRSGSNGDSEEEETECFEEYSNDELEESLIDAVGVTEEVLAFARNIAHHPETWLDFPIEEEDFDDFDLSDAQHRHAFVVEQLAPRLAALRIELCPVHMSEGYFWMVYFVLLHTRLSRHDAELLSTSQLVEARAMWRQELQKKTKPDSDIFGMNTFLGKESTYSPREDFDSPSSEDAYCRYFMPQRSFGFEPTAFHTVPEDETENLKPELRTEVHLIDKVVIEEDPPSKITEKELAAGPSSKPPFLDYDEHEDDWLRDIEDSEGYSGTAILIENEEEISFSDLEDDTDCTMPVKSKLF